MPLTPYPRPRNLTPRPLRRRSLLKALLGTAITGGTSMRGSQGPQRPGIPEHPSFGGGR